MTLPCARDLAVSGIRVCAIAPGQHAVWPVVHYVVCRVSRSCVRLSFTELLDQTVFGVGGLAGLGRSLGNTSLCRGPHPRHIRELNSTV